MGDFKESKCRDIGFKRPKMSTAKAAENYKSESVAVTPKKARDKSFTVIKGTSNGGGRVTSRQNSLNGMSGPTRTLATKIAPSDTSRMFYGETATAGKDSRIRKPTPLKLLKFKAGFRLMHGPVVIEKPGKNQAAFNTFENKPSSMKKSEFQRGKFVRKYSDGITQTEVLSNRFSEQVTAPMSKDLPSNQNKLSTVKKSKCRGRRNFGFYEIPSERTGPTPESKTSSKKCKVESPKLSLHETELSSRERSELLRKKEFKSNDDDGKTISNASFRTHNEKKRPKTKLRIGSGIESESERDESHLSLTKTVPKIHPSRHLTVAALGPSRIPGDIKSKGTSPMIHVSDIQSSEMNRRSRLSPPPDSDRHTLSQGHQALEAYALQSSITKEVKTNSKKFVCKPDNIADKSAKELEESENNATIRSPAPGLVSGRNIADGRALLPSRSNPKCNRVGQLRQSAPKKEFCADEIHLKSQGFLADQIQRTSGDGAESSNDGAVKPSRLLNSDQKMKAAKKTHSFKSTPLGAGVFGFLRSGKNRLGVLRNVGIEKSSKSKLNRASTGAMLPSQVRSARASIFSKFRDIGVYDRTKSTAIDRSQYCLTSMGQFRESRKEQLSLSKTTDTQPPEFEMSEIYLLLQHISTGFRPPSPARTLDDVHLSSRALSAVQTPENSEIRNLPESKQTTIATKKQKLSQRHSANVNKHVITIKPTRVRILPTGLRGNCVRKNSRSRDTHVRRPLKEGESPVSRCPVQIKRSSAAYRRPEFRIKGLLTDNATSIGEPTKGKIMECGLEADSREAERELQGPRRSAGMSATKQLKGNVCVKRSLGEDQICSGLMAKPIGSAEIFC